MWYSSIAPEAAMNKNQNVSKWIAGNSIVWLIYVGDEIQLFDISRNICCIYRNGMM